MRKESWATEEFSNNRTNELGARQEKIEDDKIWKFPYDVGGNGYFFLFYELQLKTRSLRVALIRSHGASTDGSRLGRSSKPSSVFIHFEPAAGTPGPTLCKTGLLFFTWFVR